MDYNIPMICPDLKHLSFELKRSPSLLRDFCTFLRSKQRDVESDVALKRIAGLEIEVDSFRRSFARVAREGLCPTHATLSKLACVLYGGEVGSIPAATALLAQFNRYCDLERPHGGAVASPSFNTGAATWVLNPHSLLAGESGRTYEVVEILSTQDSHTESYKAVHPALGKVFIKTPAIPRRGEAESLKADYEYLKRALDREILSLRELAAIQGTSGVARAIERVSIPLPPNDQLPAIPGLIQQFLPGENLESVVANSRSHIFRQPSIWFAFARRLLEILRMVHDTSVIHGKVEPANVMVFRGKPSLVDFSEATIASIMLSRIESRPVQHSQWAAPENEITTAGDIYGVAATLLYAACGEAPPQLPDSNMSTSECRAYIREFVRERIPRHTAFNQGILHVIVQGLQPNPADRPATANEMLRTLDAFTRIKASARRSRSTIYEEATSLATAVQSLPPHSLFHRIVERDLSVFLRRTRDMTRLGRCDVSGDRDTMILTLLEFLSELRRGDLYATVTTPKFWDDNNLGVDGRFLAANKILALREVRIKRLFAVLRSERGTDNWKLIREAQLRVIDELGTDKLAADNSLAVPGYYVGVTTFESEARRQELLSNGRHIGIIQRDQEVLSLSFDETGGRIRRLTMWQSANLQLLEPRLVQIENHLQASAPIRDMATL